MERKARSKGKTKVPAKDFWNLATGFPYAYVIFFLSVLLIYGQTWSFPLGKLDDEFLIINPLSYLQDWKNIPDAFARDAFLSRHGSLYRPLQVISFMIDARFYSSTGSVYYVTNTLLHFATCCALFYLLTMVVIDRKGAFIFAFLYLVAPLFVSAVAWAPARGDLLIGLTGTLTLAFFIKMLNTGSVKFGIISLIAFTASVFSKETAVLIPVLLILYYLANRRENKIAPGLVIMIFAGFLAIATGYFFLRAQVVRNALTTSEFNVNNALHNLRVFPEYLGKFLIPADLSPMPAFSLFPTVLGMLVLTGLIVGTVRYTPKPWVWGMFGLVWFFMLTLPGAMFTHEFGSAAYDYLEHRAYLPLIGIILALVFIYNGIGEEKIKKHVATGTVLLSVLLGIYSFVYTGNYKDPMTFFQRALATNPNSAVAYVDRGFYIAKYLDDPKTAMVDFYRALQLKPGYAVAYLNKGVAHYNMGDKAAAIVQYDSAIKYQPGNFQAHFNKANALAELGYMKEALAEYGVAVRLDPLHAQSHAARGVLFYELEDLPAAMRECSLAVLLDGNNTLALTQRGIIRFVQHDLEGACGDWSKAAALNYGQARELLNTYCGK